MFSRVCLWILSYPILIKSTLSHPISLRYILKLLPLPIHVYVSLQILQAMLSMPTISLSTYPAHLILRGLGIPITTFREKCNYEAPQCVVFLTLLSLPLLRAQIFSSALCSHSTCPSLDLSLKYKSKLFSCMLLKKNGTVLNRTVENTSDLNLVLTYS